MTAEIHKKRYIYYHCTKSRKNCDEILYREEDLAVQFDQIVKNIMIDPSIHQWLVQALRESHKEETAHNQESLARLQDELKKLKNRLDRL